MPISTQLTQLARNVGALTADTNAIFEALRAKGVNVPANAQLSDVADMIEEIEVPLPTVNIGGRDYPYVQIGNQLWLAENLDYAWNGLTVGSSGTSSSESRANYYNNDESTYGVSGNKYGLLYNWIAINYLEQNKSTLLPSGWHVPTKTEWDILAIAVGGTDVAGLKLKSTTGWNSGNGDGTYGFNAFPAGYYNGDFNKISIDACFWTTTITSDVNAYFMYIGTGTTITAFGHTKVDQLSVRLVKDAPGYVTIGGRQYKTVTIGNQEWLAENLDYKWSGLDIGTGGTSTVNPKANYYDNDESTYGVNGRKCGLLYNWIAVKYLEDNKSTMLPDGWKVPDLNDVDSLRNTIGGSTEAYKLRSLRDPTWMSQSWYGTNEYRLNIIPSGDYNEYFYNIGTAVTLWTSTEDNSSAAYCTWCTTTLVNGSVTKLYEFPIRLVRTLS